MGKCCCNMSLRMQGDDGKVRKCLQNKDGIRELVKGGLEEQSALIVVSSYVHC
jgi:hypothetical protein